MRELCRRQENTWIILSLLGIEKSIIVLNKCDLVDEEWLELVEEEVRRRAGGNFEHAPVVKVSAATGEGIAGLVDEIVRLLPIV